MKRVNPILSVLIAVILTLAISGPARADEYTDVIDVFKKSEAVQPFFNKAYGYAVFPIIGKAGFFIGGAYGEGQVYRQGVVTGDTSLVKATIGFQLGAQAFSEIVFFEDKSTYDQFTKGNYEFDAAASAVVITAGVQAKVGSEGATASATAGPETGAQANTNYQKGVAVFIHARGGLMYEVSVGGQKFNFTAK